jgi:hypothetical protein
MSEELVVPRVVDDLGVTLLALGFDLEDPGTGT